MSNIVKVAASAVVILTCVFAFSPSEATNLLVPEAKLKKFTQDALKALREVNNNNLPKAVKLQVSRKTPRPEDKGKQLAFIKKDLEWELEQQGVLVQDVKDFVLDIKLEESPIMVAAAGDIVAPLTVPGYVMEGSASGPGGRQSGPFSTRAIAGGGGVPQEIDSIFEEQALIEGIHIDMTKEYRFKPTAQPDKLLRNAKAEPDVDIQGTRVRSAAGGAYAVEVCRATLKTVDGMRLIEAGAPITPYFKHKEREKKYAHVDLHRGQLFVLQLHNYDQGFEASARVMIDTLDSFEFSTNEQRKKGGARWWIDKNNSAQVNGWDYKDGKALAFMVGTTDDVDVGNAAENKEIGRILSYKTSETAGQICVSFIKVWPKGTQGPADETMAGLRLDRIVPGPVFDRKLIALEPRERGLFRANIVIRYGDW